MIITTNTFWWRLKQEIIMIIIKHFTILLIELKNFIGSDGFSTASDRVLWLLLKFDVFLFEWAGELQFQ